MREPRVNRTRRDDDHARAARRLRDRQHPLCRLIEIERGTVFEVEQRRTYEAGPGLRKVCLIEPATGARRAVDQNLQPVDDHQPALMCDGLYLGRGAAPARPESGTTQRNNKPEAMAVVAGRT